MRRLLPLLLLLGGLAPAQNAPAPTPQAPPEVDAALRERIRIFYQAHVDGKFRLADQVVAEDSKDYFFAAEKARLLSFEILSIKYADDFARATAVVNSEREVLAPMMGRIKMKVAQTSFWKQEGGQWFWYVDPNAAMPSPFGPMRPGPAAATPGAPAPLPKGVSLEDLGKMVHADKSAVELPSGGSAGVTITNLMPGGIKLTLQAPKIPGFEAALDRTELVQNQSARLTLQYQRKSAGAKPPPTARVLVGVEPSGQQIPVRVSFK